MSSGVAAEKITQARLRVQEVRDFQEEIGKEALELAKRLQALKAKFKGRIHDKKNQEGFLNHSLDKYVGCVGGIDYELLQSLFHEDLIYWEAISKGAIKNQTAFKDTIDSFMLEQADKLQEILFANT